MAKRKPPTQGPAEAVARQASAEVQASAPAQTDQFSPSPLGLELQDHLGEQLRALYDEILDEPVPERFLRLLTDLENKASGSK